MTNELRRLARKLLQLEGVVGVSVKDPENIQELRLYIEREEDIFATPMSISGVIVKKIVVGKIRALAIRRSKIRPLVGGISVGPMPNTGTLGLITLNGLALSNSHVFAMNEITGKYNDTGTIIYQPGPLDGGGSADTACLYLDDYFTIKFNDDRARNYADAATAIPSTGYLSNVILWYEQIDRASTIEVRNVSDVREGDIAYKFGRTTGLTSNTVIDTNAIIVVDYGSFGYAVFEDVVLIREPFAQPGDSGSALLNEKGMFCGLVFAGSERVACACKPKYFVKELNLDIGEYILPEPERPQPQPSPHPPPHPPPAEGGAASPIKDMFIKLVAGAMVTGLVSLPAIVRR